MTEIEQSERNKNLNRTIIQTGQRKPNRSKLDVSINTLYILLLNQFIPDCEPITFSFNTIILRR